MRLRPTAAAFVATLVLCSTASAGSCGDDIDGRRVPCACGDVVVTDTTLLPSDPIVTGRCPLDGLTVRADRMAETIELRLSGLAIVGQGAGSGVLVAYGGADGALIAGGTEDRNGEIVGFGTGLKVAGLGAARRIEHVALKGNRRDGLSLRSGGTLVIDVLAEKNSGDGLVVSGRGGRLIDVKAVGNGKSGVRLAASDVIVNALVADNASHGIVAEGQRTVLSSVDAENNGGYGVLVGAAVSDTSGVRGSGNALGPIGRRKRSGER